MREMPRLDKIASMQLAKQYTEGENHTMKINNATKAIIIYKGKKLMGAIQHFWPADKEIVLVAHSSFYLDPTFLECLIELGGPRIELTVDDEIELAKRQDVLRLQGNKLTILTPVQYRIASLLIDEKSLIEISPNKHAIENYKREPIEVRHRDLARIGDSVYRSKCPSCANGILLVRRNQQTFEILAEDNCIECGQRYIYTDLPEKRSTDQINENLMMYTVYNNPLDYPGKFVVRKSCIAASSPVHAAEIYCVGDSIDEVRSKLPIGLVCLTRMPGDEPHIMETWL